MSVEELVQHLGSDATQLLPGLLAHGTDFLAWIVEHLVDSLQLDYAFVGEIAGANYDNVQTIEVFNGNAKAENFTYELHGTPYEEVLSKELFSCTNEVAQEFPEDRMLEDLGTQAYFGMALLEETGTPLGIVVLLHNSPVSREKARSVRALLRLVQPRIEAEMRYRRVMDIMKVIASSALSLGGTVEQLVTSLAQVTHVKCAYVALHERLGERTKVENVVTVVHGEVYEGHVCSSPCPCENVELGKPVRVTEKVLDNFSGKFLEEVNAQAYFAMAFSDAEGKLLGHVGLIHDRPVHGDIFSLPLFEIIVARLGAELCQQVELKKTFSGKVSSSPESETGFADSGEIDRSVLVIDDDPLVRKVLKTVLWHMGLHALLASGGSEGIALFEEHHEEICFVLLDFTMPGMTGDRVLVQLRKIDVTTPIALVSGNVDSHTIANFPVAPTTFLGKPFTKQALGEMLEKYGVGVSTKPV